MCRVSRFWDIGRAAVGIRVSGLRCWLKQLCSGGWCLLRRPSCGGVVTCSRCARYDGRAGQPRCDM